MLGSYWGRSQVERNQDSSPSNVSAPVFPPADPACECWPFEQNSFGLVAVRMGYSAHIIWSCYQKEEDGKLYWTETKYNCKFLSV